MLLCTSFTFVKFPFAYIVSTVFELLLLADILTPFPVVCIPCPYPIVTPVLIPLLELFELYEWSYVKKKEKLSRVFFKFFFNFIR